MNIVADVNEEEKHPLNRVLIYLKKSDSGDFYDVGTAHIVRRDLYKNKNPLWERTPNVQGVANLNSSQGTMPTTSKADVSNATQATPERNEKLLDSVSAKNDVQGIFKSYAAEAGVKYKFPGQAPSFRILLEMVANKRGVPVETVIAEAAGAVSFATAHPERAQAPVATLPPVAAKPNEFVALTPNAENAVTVKGEYRVVDASDLVFVDVADKEQQDEQERNRQGARTEEQVQRMAHSFKAQRLTEDNHTDRGAPMYRVTEDGKLRSVSGEGRSRLLKKIYELGGDPELQYRTQLEAFARERGIEIPEGVKQPILIRVATDTGGLTWAQLAKASNTDMKSVYSTAEEAHADARELAKILDLLSIRSDDDMLGEKNAAFVSAFNEAIGAGTQYTEDRRGGFKETIGLRIQNALVAHFISNREIATDLFDSPLSFENALNTLRVLSVDLVRMMGNENYNLAPEVAAALKAAIHARGEKERGNDASLSQIVELYFEQNTFGFEDNARSGIDLGAAKMLTGLILDRRHKTYLGRALVGYITEVERANGIDGNEMGLFGEQDWGAKSELMQKALDKLDGNAPSERGSESIKVNHDVATPTSDGKIKVAEEAAKVNGIRYSLGFSRGNAETQRIEAEARANGTWLKAPNGKPSKLPPRQWVQVRTEAFKKWFGDWEFEHQLTQILQMSPIHSLAGTEFQKDGVPLTDKVTVFWKEKHNGVAVNPTLGEVKLDREGVKDSLGHGIGSLKSAAYAAVPSVIERGIIFDRQTNWKNRGYDTTVLAAPITINSKEYICEVVVETRPNRQGFYLHEVELKEKVENAFKTPTKGSASPTSRLILNQKADKVKQDGVSQIVDENGEPNVGTYGAENPDIRWSLSQADLPGLENAGWDLFEAVAKEKPEAKPVIDEIKKELTKRVAFDSFRRKPGEHKTLSDIRNTFGLLSLKIGQRAGKKWVSEDEVYDALLDLAEVADIPPAAIGLGGRIQFQVAGRSTTLTGGTYAPRKRHITLYRRGELAHEWMHALDNYFGGMFNGFRGKTNPYNSHPVRKEVADAFDNLRDVISESEFAKRSRKERGAFWRTDHEMLARAFEIYAFTKAQYDEEAGQRAHKEAEAILDEYQKQRREGKRFSSEEIDELRSRQKELFENSERLRHFLATDRDSHIRPKKEELESDGITAAFDRLFHELQWEQQGQNVRLYSISERNSIEALTAIAEGNPYGILYNPKYGEIRYPLGKLGEGGFGFLHIVEQRIKKDGATLDEALDVALRVGIAAEIGEETKSEKNTRHLDVYGHRAIIALMDNGIPIITGYKISADSIEGAKQPSSSLQRNPLVREEDVVAALKEKLAQVSGEVKDNEPRWSISEREQEVWDNQKKFPRRLVSVGVQNPQGAIPRGKNILTEKDFTEHELGIVKVNDNEPQWSISDAGRIDDVIRSMPKRSFKRSRTGGLHDIDMKSRRMIQQFIQQHNDFYSKPAHVRALKIKGIALAKTLLARKLTTAPQSMVEHLCRGNDAILQADVKARGEMLARLMRDSIHTPAKGVTSLRRISTAFWSFNPHSREGSDCLSFTATERSMFQSTLPRRE